MKKPRYKFTIIDDEFLCLGCAHPATDFDKRGIFCAVCGEVLYPWTVINPDDDDKHVEGRVRVRYVGSCLMSCSPSDWQTKCRENGCNS